jgi:hypothetical protein
MTSILIVERTGEIKPLTVKQFDRADLFKKAGFKVAEGFDEQATWIVPVKGVSYTISVFAKSKGRAGQENKYDFPPPVDSTLFFGAAVLVRWTDAMKTQAIGISAAEWEVVYEELFGGFEDLCDTAEADEEDLRRPDTPVLDESGAVIPVSKHGYLMDGFIVDDAESTNDGFETEEEEVLITAKPKKRAKATKKAPTGAKLKDATPTGASEDLPTDSTPKEPKKSKKKSKTTTEIVKEIVKEVLEEALKEEESAETPKKKKASKPRKAADEEDQTLPKPNKKRASKKKSDADANPAPTESSSDELQPPIPIEELAEEEYFK